MFKLLFLVSMLCMGSMVRSQDGTSDFNNVLLGVIQQWGQISSQDFAEFWDKFQSTGSLNHIWHGLGEHCSSNVQCGPDACCLKPTLQGKRAVTDGNNIHFGSYCAKLRISGETCSKHDNNLHYYNFHCPCLNNLKCEGNFVQLHPLITIQTDSVCK